MNKRKLAAFLGASLFYWIGLYLYVPTLPEFVKLRSPSLAAIGVVLSMYGLWQAVVRIPLGITIDATGRGKVFLVSGFLITGLGAVVMTLGTGLGMVTFGRALTGVAAGTWVPLIAVFSGFFPPKQAVLATSLLSFSNSIGRMIATSATGFLNQIGGYPLAFYLAGACGLAAAIIIGATRIERQSAHAVSVRSIVRIFTRPDVLFPAGISSVGQFGTWVVIFGFMPLLARQLGASAVTMSFLITLNIIASVAGNLLNTLVINRFSRTSLLYVNFALFSTGILLFAVAQSLTLFYVGTALMGITFGMSFPTLLGLSIERVDQSHRTTAMGIHQAVYAIGMFAGPWAGGIVSDAVGIRNTFALSAAFCLIGAYVLILLRKRVLSRATAR
jgi:predicted MFS family arabinose efflux permease